jgi:type III secretion protein C
MTLPFFRNCIAATVTVTVLACTGLAPSAFATARTPWLEEPYTYVGDGESIQRVLSIFGRQFGLAVDVGDDVAGTINGEVAELTPARFLDRLSSMYGFDWYLDKGVLHISTINQRVRKIVKAPASVIGQLRGALIGAGVYDPRFGWGELVGQGQLLISGPPAYVARLEQTIGMIAAAPSGFQIALFPLKYANVDDRVIIYRDKQTVIPGVATIVRSLAGGLPDRRGARTTSGTTSNFATILGNTGLHSGIGHYSGVDNANLLQSNTSNASNALNAAYGTSAGGASAVNPNGAPDGGAADGSNWRAYQGAAMIEADVRTNSLIIKAPPEMLAFYKQLIEQLDTEAPLVQIEVTILDIDSDYLEDVGAKWALSNTGGSALFNLSPLSATINTILPRGFDLNAQINLLQRDGRGEVISKPSLLTMDNTAALFDSNETSYIRTTGRYTSDAIPVSAGLNFKVVPRVIHADQADGSGNRKILLQIDIEDGRRVNQSSQELPVFKRSIISTQAIVGENESLLIAGHQRHEAQTVTTSVPGLGAIPLIGRLFRHEHEAVNRRTRFFVITPRIVHTLALDNEVALPVLETARGMHSGSDPANPETSSTPAVPSVSAPVTDAS